MKQRFRSKSDQLTGDDFFWPMSEETSSPDADQHSKEHLATLLAFGTLVSAFLVADHHRRPSNQKEASFSEVLMLALATHKLGRLISKSKVAGPLRDPFVKNRRADGFAEVDEEVRGEGCRRAIGEIITCPYCVGVWLASGLKAASIYAPRVTRLCCEVFSSVAVSDFLNQAFVACKDRAASSGDPKGN